MNVQIIPVDRGKIDRQAVRETGKEYTREESGRVRKRPGDGEIERVR